MELNAVNFVFDKLHIMPKITNLFPDRQLKRGLHGHFGVTLVLIACVMAAKINRISCNYLHSYDPITGQALFV